jgi:predicted Zn-dependent protease
VAIPLIAMVGLLGYVVTTTVDSAVSLDRAPNLVNATAVPAAKFGTFVEAERTAAVVYLFQPSPANLQAYQAAIAATDKAKPAFTAALISSGEARLIRIALKSLTSSTVISLLVAANHVVHGDLHTDG